MALDVVTYVLCKNFTKAQIAQVIESLGEGMKFKGSVPTQEDLPATAANGDLYLINDKKCKAVRYNNAWLIFDIQPTKLSQLANDTGYITESALVNLATKEEVAELESIVSGKANKTYVDQADTTLQTNITNEVNARESAINAVNESINQESITREQADITLQNNIDLKQNKLTAGSSISITDANVISVNIPFIELTGQSGTLTDDQINILSNNTLAYIILNNKRYNFNKISSGRVILAEYTNILDSSSDKINVIINQKTWEHKSSDLQLKLSAGQNITITNNVINADTGLLDVFVNGESVVTDKVANLDLTSYAKLTDLQIGRTFTTNVTVGHLESGTDIFSTDTLGDLIYRILYKEPVGDLIDLYFGATDNIPVDKSGLTKLSNQSMPTLLSDGCIHNIVCGHGEGAQSVAQYAVFACDKKLVLDKWMTTDFPYPLVFKTVDKGTYNIYYLEDPCYDTPDGINYKFEFKEGE